MRVALAAVVLLISSLAYATSLRFEGVGTSSPLGVVEIPLLTGKPVNVGATDITIEFWLKTTITSGAGACTRGANTTWTGGRLVVDRDVWGSGDFGDYGFSISSTGTMMFGGAQGSTDWTVCSSTSVATGTWVHVAATRAVSSGQIRLFVGGVEDMTAYSGPSGNIAYNEAHPVPSPNDPYLVLGGEKHNVASDFDGWLDALRLSNTIRYTATFTPPCPPTTDANTKALYLMEDGSGTDLTDTSGASGGPSNGVLEVGGSPSGPTWSSDDACPAGAPFNQRRGVRF